jgi:hypothetical protein
MMTLYSFATMSHQGLGEFEQLVLLAIVHLRGEAYGIPIVAEIERHTSRRDELKNVVGVSVLEHFDQPSDGGNDGRHHPGRDDGEQLSRRASARLAGPTSRPGQRPSGPQVISPRSTFVLHPVDASDRFAATNDDNGFFNDQ